MATQAVTQLETHPEHTLKASATNTRAFDEESSVRIVHHDHKDVAGAQSKQEINTARPKLSTTRSAFVITQLCGIHFVTAFTNGVLLIELPAIAKDLELASNLLLWPNAVFYLTCGSCLLLAGSVADVIGPKKVALTGACLVAAFIGACGMAQNGISFIMLRCFHGIATAIVVPSAVSIISTDIPDGRPRNIGFSSFFLSMPLGYALGLLLGGVFVGTVGWRVGFYVPASLGVVLTIVAFRALPQDPRLGSFAETMRRFATRIDWMGSIVASASLAMFSYVLAVQSADIALMKQAKNIVLLALSLILAPVFVWWMHFQDKRGKPALIPNSLWSNTSFTSVCVMVLFSNAVNNCMQLFCSLYFQQVELLTATETSIRILPQVIVGVVLNIFSGYFINQVPVMAAVMSSSILTAVAPLLMAVIQPGWSYWYCAFWVQLLTPLSVNVLFTVGTLVVTSAFPRETQAVAGAVFQTFPSLGTSIGFCVMQVISSDVTAKSAYKDKSSPAALMEGYRAAFWALLAFSVLTCAIGAAGLRKVGHVGVKRD